MTAVTTEFFPDYVQRHGRDVPDAFALRQKGQEPVTWAELARTANRIGNQLRAIGCARGDPVAFIGRNSIKAVELMAGALAAGCVLVPLPTMATRDVLEAMLKDCGAKVLAVDEAWLEVARDLAATCPAILAEGCLGIDCHDSDFREFDLWAADASEEASAHDLVPEDLFAVVYSSGTTGVPKGIMLDHGTRLGQATLMSMAGFVPGAVNLISTPLYSYGALSTWMSALVGGATSLLVSQFDAREFVAQIEEHKGTHAILVPVQYQRILRIPDLASFDLSSMQFWFGGSAPMTEGTKKALVDTLPGEILEMYSLTEGGVTTVLAMKQFPDKLGSVGMPSGGCDLRIIDEDGKEVAPGEIGEIVGRSALKMSGYLNQDVMSRDVIWRDADGLDFIRSGDNGRLDEDGFLYLLDRKKDMIISGGFNIYATDIEEILNQHEDILDATVVAAPSKNWGESPYAFVVLEEGSILSAEDIRDWANERLGKTQRLGGAELRPDLPRNQLGKIHKNDLRRALIDSGLWLD